MFNCQFIKLFCIDKHIDTYKAVKIAKFMMICNETKITQNTISRN